MILAMKALRSQNAIAIALPSATRAEKKKKRERKIATETA
jgi:hypothetical protein